MTPEKLAELHAVCFVDAPRPWTAAEFRELLTGEGVKLLCHSRGFAVVRLAGPEAELLTIAVAPEARRQGIGRLLVTDMVKLALMADVKEVLLEVSETNDAARKL